MGEPSAEELAEDLWMAEQRSVPHPVQIANGQRDFPDNWKHSFYLAPTSEMIEYVRGVRSSGWKLRADIDAFCAQASPRIRYKIQFPLVAQSVRPEDETWEVTVPIIIFDTVEAKQMFEEAWCHAVTK